MSIMSTHQRPMLTAINSEDEDYIDDHDPKVDEQHLLEKHDAPEPPPDRFNFNYAVFYLLGMTTLMPWNFIMTPEDYWMYKFRNTTATGINATALTPDQVNFTAYLSVASAVPNTLLLVLNAYWGHKFSLHKRMIFSMLTILALFMVTTGFVEVNTDNWQHLFLQWTLTIVVCMNCASAILSGGLFGLAGMFPSIYITAVSSGQSLGGIFAAIAEIISLTFGANPNTTAFVYFSIANVILVISLGAYCCMSQSTYFAFFTRQEMPRIVGGAVVEPKFREILQKIWMYGVTEWLVFVVTLSVYPAVTVLVNSQHHGNGHPWNDIYFTPVVNYLLFNSSDYLGRILAGTFEWPIDRPRLVVALSAMRIFFLPVLLLCNTSPRHFLPVFIQSDMIYISILCAFAFTNGYLANIALICAPKTVEGARQKEMASSMMAAFLGIGLAFGSAISVAFVAML